MQRQGICVAGNMIVDLTYPIECWPGPGELTTVTGEAALSTGGLACNVTIDLAKMDPHLPLKVLGVLGLDPEGDFISRELGTYSSIDQSCIQRRGKTSFTVIMSSEKDKSRTYFQYRGANATFCEDDIDWENMTSSMLHIGYLLLLDSLDAEDPEYGTRMARLLHHAQQRGIRTSIDVVTETGGRFKKLVPPALRFSDFGIINELEAQQITGVALRGTNGELHSRNMKAALDRLLEMGVAEWAVIHCPEGGYGTGAHGGYAEASSLILPAGFTVNTVGAGDAFCSGVLYAAYNNLPLEDALRLGIAAASASLRAPSATDGMAPVDDIRGLYSQYGGA